MKTVLEYLKECHDMALHNQLCYSATYAMDTPTKGYEKEYAEAVRDGQIVDELTAMVKGKEAFIEQMSTHEEVKIEEAPAKQTPPWECPLRGNCEQLKKLLDEIGSFVSCNSP